VGAFSVAVILVGPQRLAGVVPESVWPVLATMFMFRMLIYLYELKHAKKPESLLDTLCYFFLLPNYCFLHFPVVDYRTLQRNARLYIQATEIGGTHPAMIEAMASNGAVLANDTPENREVGGDAVRYFAFSSGEGLASVLRRCLDASAATDVYRSRARTRAREKYGWDGVVDVYEALFRRLAVRQ
jgi:glycosyltransferase involved in cell wall biosynthesis